MISDLNCGMIILTLTWPFVKFVIDNKYFNITWLSLLNKKLNQNLNFNDLLFLVESRSIMPPKHNWYFYYLDKDVISLFHAKTIQLLEFFFQYLCSSCLNRNTSSNCVFNLKLSRKYLLNKVKRIHLNFFSKVQHTTFKENK